MGLGKTLQSICMLAGDHTQRKNGPEVMECILPKVALTVLPLVECTYVPCYPLLNAQILVHAGVIGVATGGSPPIPSGVPSHTDRALVL